ncbi:MAG: hypothetical protein FJY21_05525, partial [Bacteroidetes bacterium]|nr:hypothetical protein [Bacteroidota bacterium]
MIKKLIPIYALVLGIFISSCQSNSKTLESGSADSISTTQSMEESSSNEPEKVEKEQKGGKKATAAEILARPQVPI